MHQHNTAAHMLLLLLLQQPMHTSAFVTATAVASAAAAVAVSDMFIHTCCPRRQLMAPVHKLDKVVRECYPVPVKGSNRDSRAHGQQT